MMDCTEILDVLGAYALGAADAEETKWVEEHVADCVKCWEELEREQQAAALLSLAVPIESVSPRLEARIISQAQRDKVGVRTEPRPNIFQRLRLGWPATAGAFGVASVAAIVFSSALQMQVQDLQDENNRLSQEVRDSTLTLQQQLQQTDSVLEEQQAVFAVLSDDSAPTIKVSAAGQDAAAYYSWSPETKKGFIRCENMPALPVGKTYQVWVTSQKVAYPIGTFSSEDGTCQVTTDVNFLDAKPAGIGISVESLPGALEHPTGGWMLYAHFSDN